MVFHSVSSELFCEYGRIYKYNKIDEIKGLTSKRSLRLAIQKGKYIAREGKVFGSTFTALAMGL